MRFIYGFISGVLTSVIAGILYLAFAGGEYLLQIAPKYHDLTSQLGALRDAKEQRDQLAIRLESLAGSFDQLTRRFNELQETGHSAGGPLAPPPGAAESEHPKARLEPTPAVPSPS